MRTINWVGLSVLLVSGTALGSFLPPFVNSSPAGGNLRYNYALVFATTVGSPAERLESGDFVTLYDVQGFVSAGAPADFTVSVQNLGVNGFGTSPTDSPTLPNVTFTYTGTTLTTDNILPGFSLVSSIFFTGVGQFTSAATSNANSTDGQPIGQIGPVRLPQFPEPGSILGLAGVGMLAMLRRRK